MASSDSRISNINNNNNKLMKTIKNHLETEMASLKPSDLRIKELTNILKRGSLTLEEWRMTGRFIPKKVYQGKNKDIVLSKECKEVVEYVGDVVIEVFKTNDFVFEDTKSKVLDEVENKLWERLSKNLWDC